MLKCEFCILAYFQTIEPPAWVRPQPQAEHHPEQAQQGGSRDKRSGEGRRKERNKAKRMKGPKNRILEMLWRRELSGPAHTPEQAVDQDESGEDMNCTNQSWLC